MTRSENPGNAGKSLQNRGSANVRHSSVPCHETVGNRTSSASVDHSGATQNATGDPELSIVVEAWERLPAAVRQAILLMVKAGG
jgi:hypothetical protein